ncbi:ammonium transporter [Pseudochrobactrum algeriensis]|uniref:ammonium transporter n=1 Tax=Pseudochrobactrum algeriensis TaxID=2834768 RepID=UPI001BCBE16F|nr:ammonium transporter [Ochrobactrum sp. MR34]QVQ36256.1 ammonium transporter [Pseudochrobactrum algeriensis]QVQ39473.1 ammonium transporter [Pseudochrobactrum algeriensis]QVQ43393.1 ammonium transporter [Pseudochrobactrum algeriensis]
MLIFREPRLSARSLFKAAFGALAVLIVFPYAQAFAQDAAAVADTGDTAWMLTSTVLVLLMTIPGVALFYGGMVRGKNALATTMQSFAIACVASVLWMVAGYSLAFSDGGSANAFIGGLSKAFFAGVTPASLTGTIPEYVFITFQMTFAIITPALIVGAFAERMKFSALLIFTILWLFIVYVPVAHWVWGGGFLGGDGVLDFAGGTVVHINSGIAGLVVALMLGKRDGYGQVNMAPHNLVYSLIGASLLWVGWFGFNAGSAGGANGIAAVAMVNTQVAAAAAALSWMVVEWLATKRPSVLGIISGAVAGLVGITPAAGFVNPAGALMIGVASGAGCYFAAVKLKHWLGYDDSLDAFGVHGVGGIIGALLTGLFADAAINPLSEGATVLKQLYGVVVTMLYTALMTALIVFVIRIFMGLRVSKATEIEGLDINLHGETVHS